jgi:hypothetical protein
MKQTLLLLGSFFLLQQDLWAQLDLGSHFLNGTWQANQTNPALLPDQKVTLALPSIYGYTQVTGFQYNDLVGKNAQGKTVLNIDNAISKMDAQNYLRNRVDLGTFGIGVRAGNWFISAGHSIRFNSFIQYPRELAQLAWKGNSQFIGQTIQISPSFVNQGYHEIALGLSYSPSPLISFGARFKVLNGFGDVSSIHNDIRLSTSSDIYQIGVQADFALNATGDLQYKNFSSFKPKIDFGGFTGSRAWTSNYGYAIDLGFSGQFGPLEIAGSVLNLGSIRWQKDVSNLTVKGNYAYNGLDIFPNILKDSLNLNKVIDTLEAKVNIVQTQSPYITALPLTAFLSAAFKIGETWRLGALLYADRYRNITSPAIGLSASLRLGEALTVGGIYTIRNNTYNNFGVNFKLKAGPVQLIGATDNLLALVKINNTISANVRLGLNVVIGSIDEEGNQGKKRKRSVRNPNFFKR